jgi:hypothetical protein
MSRIRVLLVDDKPAFCMDIGHESEPHLPNKYTKHFELTWIQNAQEARWAMETFELISQQHPERLSAIGWPPEIVVFDYALTGGGRERREDSDPTNICSRLGRIVADARLDYGFGRPSDIDPPPQTEPMDRDRTGCYVGGALARTFSLHPCGAVPTTAKVDTRSTDADFYQWLNSRYFYGLFKEKERGSPQWEDLLIAGVRAVRERIVELVRTDVIRVAPANLFELRRDAAAMRERDVVFFSRYGRREVPVAGLFVDFLAPDGNEDQEGFSSVASAWADKLLEALFRGHGHEQFQVAKALAAKYWHASLSEASMERYELSQLAVQQNRTEHEETQMTRLCEKMGLNAEDVRADPANVPVNKVAYPLGLWRKVANNDAVARWSALMLAVRAEQHHRLATEAGFFLWSVMAEGGDEIDGVRRTWLEDRLGGKEELDRLLEEAKIRLESYVDGDEEVFEVPVGQAARIDDIFTALDPLPDYVLTYLQKGLLRDGTRGKDTTVLSNPLKRLGGDGRGWGPLGLSLSDLLQNQEFDCPLCGEALRRGVLPPSGDHKDPTTGRRYSHGLRRGEGPLLRMYADEIGFPASKWPAWLSTPQ